MGIRELLKNRIIISDGAMGTMLQQYGLKAGELPEQYNFTHPQIIHKIQRSYLDAGSDLISTNTFGANRLKLQDTAYSVEETIEKAVCISRATVDSFREETGKDAYVALDLGPIGKLMEPSGDLGFEEACTLFREQIEPGVKAGADLILFETFTDSYEMKAAIVTAREITDLPLFCSVTFEQDGRMLMGADPLTVVNSLQDLGIDALGINCSLGPVQMIPLIKEILKYCRLPVLVQPNAGLPVMTEKGTVYDIGIDEFTNAVEEMVYAGVSVVGGCCGTTPEYINGISNRLKSIGYITNKSNIAPLTAVSSATKTVVIDKRVRIIGERINPTGKNQLKQALKQKDFTYIENEAVEQAKAGADILDINVGLPEVDEKQMMLEVIRRLSSMTDLPLQIDSADPKVLEAAARIYNGKPIINSVNGKQEVMDAVFPIVKKYGTCVIALTLDEKGLPKNTEERLVIAERIINEAWKYGIGKERILVDCLTLTISAKQQAGNDTLSALRHVKQRFNVKTTLGASNVSFGLPSRKLLNSTFLAMALEAGLDAPITDPTVNSYMDTIRAYEALSGGDEDCRDYIEHYGGNNEEKIKLPRQDDNLGEIIVKGLKQRGASLTRDLIKAMPPLKIVEEIIFPSLETVGKQYESGEKFLPQLIQSADTVKECFNVIKETMESTGETICYGKVVLATVKGDIHDIGKNIVKLLLENYGYQVVDLGKDTDIERIVNTVLKEEIRLVGLSALMTTTVVNMEATVKSLREKAPNCRIAVGGAVLNPEYAARIKADYYCKDAMDGVRVANRIFKGES